MFWWILDSKEEDFMMKEQWNVIIIEYSIVLPKCKIIV